VKADSHFKNFLENVFVIFMEFTKGSTVFSLLSLKMATFWSYADRLRLVCQTWKITLSIKKNPFTAKNSDTCSLKRVYISSTRYASSTLEGYNGKKIIQNLSWVVPKKLFI